MTAQVERPYWNSLELAVLADLAVARTFVSSKVLLKNHWQGVGTLGLVRKRVHLIRQKLPPWLDIVTCNGVGYRLTGEIGRLTPLGDPSDE